MQIDGEPWMQQPAEVSKPGGVKKYIIFPTLLTMIGVVTRQAEPQNNVRLVAYTKVCREKNPWYLGFI